MRRTHPKGEIMPRPLPARIAALSLVPALALALAATAVPAQQADSRAARDQLFPERGRSVVVADVSFLGEAERKAVEQYAQQFAYYAAMAVSPGDPASTGSAVAVANYHSAADAQAAALKGCNARRTTGQPCVIVATVLPRGYAPRPLTLSLDATAAVRKEYRRLQSPKALAVSPATGAFAYARGDGGRAIAACNAEAAKKGAQDCRVAVADN
jgi:hypothetical protein